MLSRSASRTRWMMFCLAACAAMRPNFSAGSLASSSSPTSASGSRLRRASPSRTSFSASSMTATTFLISNSSTSPTSGLNLASMFLSAPNVRLAADSMACSRASTMIWRSMPFSLLTCSMTRLRSGSISPPPLRVSWPVRWASEVVFDVGPFDVGEREDGPSGVGIVDGGRIVADRGEDPAELPSPPDRGAHAHRHALSLGAAEMLRPQQGPVQARRRAFEMIPPGHRIVRIEEMPYLARNPGQLVDGHASGRTIDQEAQDRASAFGAVLHVDELEPRRHPDGLRQPPDTLGDRRPIHECLSSK